ncbi:MAG: PorT family protein [Acidobacteriota bacterium]|nr:PorT family protein [Acidobacteriota bacterium]
MRKILMLPVLCALGCAAAGAQALSVGILGGAPFQDVVNSATSNNIQSIPKSTNFTIGPTVQVNLPLSLRIEVDALFRPYNFQLSLPALTQSLSGQQWRFPVLLQYRFSAPLVKPFVEGGISFDHLSGISDAVKSSIQSGPGQFLRASNAGVVLGAGVDVKLPIFRLSGELRYTRETVSDFATFSNLNQAEALIGIHF